MSSNYDFSGMATRYNVRCSDGRTILPNAFADGDGQTVPLVWGHNHEDPYHVLGNALLKHEDGGVRAYCAFNDTEAGQLAKELVKHGDIKALSIYANKLKQNGADVCHGVIREVSLVMAGANDGAFIDTILAHGENGEEEGEIFMGEDEFNEPSESETDEQKDDANESKDEPKDIEHSDKEDAKEKNMAEEKKEKTVGDVLESIESKLDEEEMDVVYGLIGMAAEGDVDEDDKDNVKHEEDGNMKYNTFDSETQSGNYFAHSDEQAVIELAKKSGSFKDAFEYYAEENGFLAHAADNVSGFYENPTAPALGLNKLFPEPKEVSGSKTPEIVMPDQGWVTKVLDKAHKLPFSRVRTSYMDLREVETLRAKGYEKGHQKALLGQLDFARRETDPQTIYSRWSLNRDDIVDITDFDYVQYLYNLCRQFLNIELATAIMFGDGRASNSDDKIKEDHIRPIWTDDEIFTIHRDLETANIQGTGTGTSFGDNYIKAESFVNTLLYARENYKGSGTPDLYIAPHMLNVMLLARDMNGRRIYSSIDELRSTLNVASIITVEQMANKTRTVTVGSSEVTKKLLALVVNMNDYSIGSTKGGEITAFNQFDIDFNQHKSLLETRVSGALTKLWSAIAIEETVANG